MMKGLSNQEDIIQEVYVPNQRDSKGVKLKLIELTGKMIETAIIIVGDTNIPLSNR